MGLFNKRSTSEKRGSVIPKIDVVIWEHDSDRLFGPALLVIQASK